MKRFKRNMSRSYAGGVCSGLSDYFCIDAIFFRLLFILMSFNVSILVYFAMWLFTDEK